MEDVEGDLNMLWRLKSLLVIVWVEGARVEGVMEAVSGRVAGGERPKRPSKAFRLLVSLRAMGGTS
jgi:hypothetical protein